MADEVKYTRLLGLSEVRKLAAEHGVNKLDICQVCGGLPKFMAAKGEGVCCEGHRGIRTQLLKRRATRNSKRQGR